MNSFTLSQLSELLPLAVEWAEAEEARILEIGVSLSPEQRGDAEFMGVLHPERVRIAVVEEIPSPEQPRLKAAAKAANLLGSCTAGLALRYGIYVRSDLASDRLLVAHELVHTAQYERCGGFTEFLSQYLGECLTIGYPGAPMEQEAILWAEKLRIELSGDR